MNENDFFSFYREHIMPRLIFPEGNAYERKIPVAIAYAENQLGVDDPGMIALRELATLIEV